MEDRKKIKPFYSDEFKDDAVRLVKSTSSYDAVCQNDSAVMKLGDEVLKRISQELVDVVRRNVTVDWNKKEQVRASLRRHIRRPLTRYRYPPDKQESAVQLVMQQAELMAGGVAA
jgi:type I restriction enzyme R subunit